MLGMGFVPFLTLLVISAVVTGVYHYVLRYRLLEGTDVFIGKVMLGWIGAWLGSPVLGHWLWNIQGVYIIPASLGAVTASHLAVLSGKTMMRIASTRVAAEAPPMSRPAAAA